MFHVLLVFFKKKFNSKSEQINGEQYSVCNFQLTYTTHIYTLLWNIWHSHFIIFQLLPN